MVLRRGGLLLDPESSVAQVATVLHQRIVYPLAILVVGRRVVLLGREDAVVEGFAALLSLFAVTLQLGRSRPL